MYWVCGCSRFREIPNSILTKPRRTVHLTFYLIHTQVPRDVCWHMTQPPLVHTNMRTCPVTISAGYGGDCDLITDRLLLCSVYIPCLALCQYQHKYSTFLLLPGIQIITLIHKWNTYYTIPHTHTHTCTHAHAHTCTYANTWKDVSVSNSCFVEGVSWLQDNPTYHIYIIHTQSAPTLQLHTPILMAVCFLSPVNTHTLIPASCSLAIVSGTPYKISYHNSKTINIRSPPLVTYLQLQWLPQV